MSQTTIIATTLPSSSATQQREAGLSVSSKRNDRSGHGRLNDFWSRSTTAEISSTVILRIVKFMRELAQQYANRSVQVRRDHPRRLPASAAMPALPGSLDAGLIAKERQAGWKSSQPVFDAPQLLTQRTPLLSSALPRPELSM